jgi:Fe-S cluster biogenesis protein NfuA
MGAFSFLKKPVRTEFEKRVAEQMLSVQEYAKSHGGRIELVSATEDGVITVQLRGSCAYCPIAPLNLKHGVEDQLRLHFPEFKELVVKS